MQENVQKPWYRKQTKSWYLELHGKQINLGKDKDDAFREYHHIMVAEGHVKPKADPGLATVFDLFLDHAQKHTAPDTFGWYRSFLQGFAKRYPRMRVGDLKPIVVHAWLDAERKRPWGQNTRRAAITILKRALNWAVKSGLIPENPIQHMERPASKRREKVLTAEERQHILDHFPDRAIRNFLITLGESVARPGEVMKVEAKDVDLKLGVWVLEGKMSKRTGRKRVIYLTPRLLELTGELCRRHPEGPLFRNIDGNPWNRQAVNCRFKRMRKSCGLAKDVTAYVWRHSWATDALERGVPIATVSELLGHTSTAMVSAHYSHLSERTEHLRKAAEEVTR